MKFYIVGTVGSGKSTLARKMGEALELPVYHLDEIVHMKNDAEKLGNMKRSDVEIDELFQEILNQESFIIEDCLRKRFTPALQQVDQVIFLDLPQSVLKYRVFKRFLKQKIGIEKANYRPSLQFLKQMLT
jgi:adenylate kinase family enzyme